MGPARIFRELARSGYKTRQSLKIRKKGSLECQKISKVLLKPTMRDNNLIRIANRIKVSS